MASMQEEGFYCIPEEQMSSYRRKVYCALCLASGTVGIIGSSWQTFQWKALLRSYRERRKPSPNPMIVVSLALANILACLGVILRSTMMLSTNPPLIGNNGTSYYPLQNNIALISTSSFIEIFITYFYSTTFLWTIIYCFDIFLQLKDINGSVILYHLTCWLVPLVTTVCSTIAKRTSPDPLQCVNGAKLMTHYLFFYCFIFITFLLVPSLYFVCNKLMKKRMQESGLMSNHNWSVLTALKKKFYAVIFLLIFCWISNVIDAIILLVAASGGYSPASLTKYFPIWTIEAVLNPLQGLFNCLVYGRHLLFWRLARNEGRLLQWERPDNERTPILNTRNASLFFVSE